MSIENRSHADIHSDNIKEKLTFVRDGAIKLPPGFRFQPTDQEIVFQYLVRKVFSCPLPTSVIPEIVNICKINPWDLPGDWEQERYFFSKKDAKYGHGNRVDRKSSDGYWKATGLDKHITRCCNNNPMARKKDTITGMKKTLVFYKGKPLTTRTHWIMHEYRLVHSTGSPSTTSNDKVPFLDLNFHKILPKKLDSSQETKKRYDRSHSYDLDESCFGSQKSWIQMGNWVLCHVLLNKRSRKSFDDGNVKRSDSHERLTNQTIMRSVIVPIDCDIESSSCSSSSSCGSSVVTDEVSSSRTPLYCEESKN